MFGKLQKVITAIHVQACAALLNAAANFAMLMTPCHPIRSLREGSHSEVTSKSHLSTCLICCMSEMPS